MEGGTNCFSLLNLMEATSNAMLPPAVVCQSGVSWAWNAGAFRAPIIVGTITAAIPTPVRISFFPRFRPTTLRFLMIASIRLLRFDPVTPDMQASGEDRYNRQIARMLSA